MQLQVFDPYPRSHTRLEAGTVLPPFNSSFLPMQGKPKSAKRQFSQVDADGDVKMAGTRGGRKRTQKRLRAMPNGREIEMRDAEASSLLPSPYPVLPPNPNTIAGTFSCCFQIIIEDLVQVISSF